MISGSRFFCPALRCQVKDADRLKHDDLLGQVQLLPLGRTSNDGCIPSALGLSL